MNSGSNAQYFLYTLFCSCFFIIGFGIAEASNHLFEQSLLNPVIYFYW